jgi:hypothetical protein
MHAAARTHWLASVVQTPGMERRLNLGIAENGTCLMLSCYLGRPPSVSFLLGRRHLSRYNRAPSHQLLFAHLVAKWHCCCNPPPPPTHTHPFFIPPSSARQNTSSKSYMPSKSYPQHGQYHNLHACSVERATLVPYSPIFPHRSVVPGVQAWIVLNAKVHLRTNSLDYCFHPFAFVVWFPRWCWRQAHVRFAHVASPDPRARCLGSLFPPHKLLSAATCQLPHMQG